MAIFRTCVKSIYQSYLSGSIARGMAYRSMTILLHEHGLLPLDHNIPESMPHSLFLNVCRWAYALEPEPMKDEAKKHFSAPMDMIQPASSSDLIQRIKNMISGLFPKKGQSQPLTPNDPVDLSKINRIIGESGPMRFPEGAGKIRTIPPNNPVKVPTHYIPPNDGSKPICPICNKECYNFYNQCMAEGRLFNIDPPRCNECTFNHVMKEMEKPVYIPDTKMADMSSSEQDFFAQYEKQMKEHSKETVSEPVWVRHGTTQPDLFDQVARSIGKYYCPRCNEFYDGEEHKHTR
jgi:hypothetical protein